MPGIGEWDPQDPATIPVWRGLQYWQQRSAPYLAGRPAGGWTPQQWTPQANVAPPPMATGRAVQFNRPQIDPAIANAWQGFRPMENPVAAPGVGPARPRPEIDLQQIRQQMLAQGAPHGGFNQQQVDYGQAMQAQQMAGGDQAQLLDFHRRMQLMQLLQQNAGVGQQNYAMTMQQGA